jgi:hypothetical protein
MDATDLRQRVFEDLDNAIEGGYFELWKMTPEAVADDLLTNSDYDETVTEEMLVPIVREWLTLASDHPSAA